MILALDQATVCGWAYGKPGEQPVFGTRNFVVRREDGNGAVIALFRAWLEKLVTEIRPSLVVYESPYAPIPGAMVPRNVSTLRRLFAMAVTVEAISWERKIRCAEVTAPEVAKFILGSAAIKRDEKKKATIQAVRNYGFDVGNDDEADAVSIWLMAEAKTNPAASMARGVGPLFLKNAPRKAANPAGRIDLACQNGDQSAQQHEGYTGSG